jgi:hypothetical protein
MKKYPRNGMFEVQGERYKAKGERDCFLPFALRPSPFALNPKPALK